MKSIQIRIYPYYYLLQNINRYYILTNFLTVLPAVEVLRRNIFTDFIREKWELISSHTICRSAATNMYLTGQMKTFEIMKLTRHRTERNFFRYIRLTCDDIARFISSDMFFRKLKRASTAVPTRTPRRLPNSSN